MPALKPNELKALGWYCKKNDLVPQLSLHPMMFFLDRQGEEYKRHMQFILREWEEWRTEDKRDKGA